MRRSNLIASFFVVAGRLFPRPRRRRTRGSGSKGRVLRRRRLRVRSVHRPGEQKHQERRDGTQQSRNGKKEHDVNVGGKSLIETRRALRRIPTLQGEGDAYDQEEMRHKKQKAGNPSRGSDLPPRSGSDIQQSAEGENYHAYHGQHNPLDLGMHAGTIRSPRIGQQDD